MKGGDRLHAAPKHDQRDGMLVAEGLTLASNQKTSTSRCGTLTFFPHGCFQMLSLAKNPFSWKDGGNISSLIGSLSLTTPGGSNIPVEELSKDIEVSSAQLICNEPDSLLDQQKMTQSGSVHVCAHMRAHCYLFFSSVFQIHLQ